MTDHQKYINALRKCAKEHENDRTSTGHIIVSDLCKDTANLLESLAQEPILDKIIEEISSLTLTDRGEDIRTMAELQSFKITVLLIIAKYRQEV